MNYVHMFSWNIPADNHYCGAKDRYLNIIATWNSDHFYSDGRPMVFVDLVNASLYHCVSVLNWDKAETEIKQLATSHFAEIAKAERIAQARATLVNEGEPTGHPVLDRYTEKMHDLIIQETLS